MSEACIINITTNGESVARMTLNVKEKLRWQSESTHLNHFACNIMLGDTDYEHIKSAAIVRAGIKERGAT
jgi:hypothetical protein